MSWYQHHGNRDFYQNRFFYALEPRSAISAGEESFKEMLRLAGDLARLSRVSP